MHLVHDVLPVITKRRVVGSASRVVVLDCKWSQAECTIIRDLHRLVQHVKKKRGMVLCDLVERLKVAMDLGNHGQ